jgi:hypothetical protein
LKKRRRAGLALGSAAIALLLAALALASPEPRVLVVGRSEKDATVTRIRQELRVLGLEVQFVRASASRGSLADKARQLGATAAAEVQTDPPAILLWTDPVRYPDVGGGPELRVDEGLTGTAEPGLLALRAAELLHGRVLPVPAQTTAPLDVATPSPAASSADPEPPRPTPLSAFVGPAALLSSGVDPSFQVWLGARVNLTTHVDLELAGAIPTTATAITGVPGTAGARLGTLGLAAGYRFTAPASPLVASAGLGLGALFSVVGGDASKAANAALGSRFAALPYLRVGAGYWLGDHVALRGDALIGVALPAPAIKVKGQEVTSLGTPTVLFAAALEVRP